MALNRRTFQTRALTAVVFVIVMVAGIFLHPWSFFLLFSVIHFGCWWEYQKLVGLIDPGYKEINSVHRYGIMIAGWSILLWFADDWYSIFGMQLNEIGPMLGLIVIMVVLLNEVFIANPKRPKNMGHSIFGLIYISLSWGLMVDFYVITEIYKGDILFYKSYGYFVPALIIACIWINDTMAYVVGSLIGKRSLTTISPGKTWEGTIGGILITMVVAGLLAYFAMNLGAFTLHVVIVAAISAIAGTFGDLLESKLKRLAGVKDSGAIMPGHGGFLDRFDSLLLAIPFVWLFVMITGRS
jgi:phosphatidate cytidylyltransferase